MKKQDMKELLVQAWKEVFQLDEVTDEADFFDDGGDSIKAVQLSAWLIQKGVKLDLVDVFTFPKLEELSDKLTETEPMYIPEALLTKEIAAQEMMGAFGGSNPMMPPTGGENGQQVCTPGVGDQQVCTPMGGQQICTPMGGQQICQGPICTPMGGQQICTPMGGQQICQGPICIPMGGQQICTPMGGQQICQGPICTPMGGQQICTPMGGQQICQGPICSPMGGQQICTPIGGQQICQGPAYTPPVMYQPVMYQPVMYQPVMYQPVCTPPMMGQPMGMGMPPQLEKYMSKPVDKPIEDPNVIKINKAKVSKPAVSAEEALTIVLNGLMPKWNKEDDLFEQGLTSLDTVKIVTRCGENGYSIEMKDIYKTPRFDDLVKVMKPGE